MTCNDPIVNAVDGFEVPESYQTFWDAIPVDTVPEFLPTTPTADPYARFVDLSEDGPAVTLILERGDI